MNNIKQTDLKSGRWLTTGVDRTESAGDLSMAGLQRCHGDEVQSSSSTFGKGQTGGDEMKGHQNQSQLFITAEQI